MRAHQKHTKLIKPQTGYFHRNEWAIVGAPCSVIQELAAHVIQRLSDRFQVGYFDADHRQDESSKPFTGALKFIDKIQYHQLSYDFSENLPDVKIFTGHLDAVIANGNHFEATQQIIILDPRKEDSLKRRAYQLTQVRAILLTDGVVEPFPFLRDQLPGFDEIPQFRLSDTESLVHLIRQAILDCIPPVHGLVLAGGFSSRMGMDKGLIEYHGKPQRQYLAELLKPFCEAVFLSCRPEQVDEWSTDISLLPDSFTSLGPFGAILSAFRHNPNVAWLVVACDLPFLNENTLRDLIRQRNASKVATAFIAPNQSNDDENSTIFPEPLIAIWEPKAYQVLLRFLGEGYSCPRKVLLNSPVELIRTSQPAVLKNVNTPEELADALRLLS